MADCYLENGCDLHININGRRIRLASVYLGDMSEMASQRMMGYGEQYMGRTVTVSLSLSATDVTDVSDPVHPKRLGRYEIAKKQSAADPRPSVSP